jgi:short-subunit dehydrogenase
MALGGKVAVVTGAASGIGRAIAHSLAARGCHLALVDLNEAGLRETAAQIGTKVSISIHVLNVVDAQAVAALPAAVATSHGQIDLLVNNAGVALGGRFDQVSEADFDWVMDINFHALVRLTRAFLPSLKQRSEARIVNLSSIFGIIAPPGQAAYSASKFAVRGFSEALRNELGGTGSKVGVTVVHPGGIKTAIADNARVPANVDPADERREREHFAAFLRMPAEKAGEIIVRGIEARRARVLVGMDAKIVSIIERVMPVGYWALLARLGLA